jgi:choline kinase
MGDHLIEEKIVRRLLDNQNFNNTLCIDYTLTQYHKIEEATKVAVDITGCIKDIGKELDHWDALDTGVFLLTDDFFKAINELVQYRGTNIETADVIRFLVSRGHHFHTCDVSGCVWQDVDTIEDLNLARLQR